MLRVALLGAGYAGRIQLQGWQTVPDVQVVGVWNRTPARAQDLGREYGVPAFEDLDALIAHPEVDAVDVATAFETHRQYALQAAAAGKHVLCQKPLAPSYEDAAAIVEGCRRAGARLMVNENWRWRPWYRAARQVLDTGALGRLFALRLSLRTDATVATPQRPPERLFAQQPFMSTMSPLIMMEIGPHHFDVVRYLFGDPSGVYARTHQVSPHVAADDVATALLEYPDRTAVVELNWHAIGYTSDRSKRLHPDELLIEGSEGSLAIREDGQVQLAFRDGRRETVAVETANGYWRSWRDTLAHFAACLASGAPFETPGEQNLATLRLVFDAYESARAGQPVRRGG